MATILASYIHDPDAVLDYSILWGANDWAQSTAYNADDHVRDPVDGKFYVCISAHTSTASGSRSTDLTKWELVADGLWLKAGDTISTSAWAITSAPDAVLVIDSDTNDSYSTTVWLSGGTAGVSYEVTNHIVTDDGREDDRTIKLKVKEK